jgi:hypothetical protein
VKGLVPVAAVRLARAHHVCDKKKVMMAPTPQEYVQRHLNIIHGNMKIGG